MNIHRYSRQEPIKIDLKNNTQNRNIIKACKSHSKLKDAIIKDNKMKFRSKAQSLNRGKGKLRLPPKLPYFKKKVRTSLARNFKQGTYVHVGQGIFNKSKQSLQSYRPMKGNHFGVSKNNRQYYPIQERSITQSSTSSTISQNMLKKNWKGSNERVYTEIMQMGKSRNSLHKNSLKYKINKNIQRISEPISFKTKKVVNYEDNRDDQFQLHSNFMKNVKNVKSYRSIATEEENDKKYVKVIRVSVNGKEVPFEKINKNDKLHSELQIHGYTSYEDNGSRGFRRKSINNSINNSYASSMTPRK